MSGATSRHHLALTAILLAVIGCQPPVPVTPAAPSPAPVASAPATVSPSAVAATASVTSPASAMPAVPTALPPASTIHVTATFPGPALSLLQRGLRALGLIDAQDLSAKDLGTFVVTVDGQSLPPSQWTIDKAERDSGGQLVFTVSLRGVTLRPGAVLSFGEPTGKLVLQTLVGPGAGDRLVLSVATTAESMLRRDLAVLGTSEAPALPAAVERLAALLESGFLSSQPGDPTQTDAFRYARAQLVTLLASGGTEAMLRQASLTRPMTSGGGGGPAAPTVPVDPTVGPTLPDFFGTAVSTVVAGSGGSVDAGDGGPARDAAVPSPSSLAFDRQGRLYLGANGRTRVVDRTTGTIAAFAGTTTPGYSGDGGPAVDATLSGITGLVGDSRGNLYILDAAAHPFDFVINEWAETPHTPTGNRRIRRVDAVTGTITTYAGQGAGPGNGDGGPATAAVFTDPVAMCIDSRDNLYVADYNDQRIRKIDAATGIITTIHTGDSPTAIACDSRGNVVFTNYIGTKIMRIDATTGAVTTIAGDGGTRNNGDGGQAVAAQMYFITHLAFDRHDNLFMVLRLPSVAFIRRIDAATGIISRFLQGESSALAPEIDTTVRFPVGMAAYGDYLYVTEVYSHKVRRYRLP